MKNTGLILFTCILLGSSSCIWDGDNNFFNCERGEGKIISKTLEMAEFAGVKLRGDGEVFITQGDGFSVEVRAQENIIDLLETDIQNRIWEIEFDRCVRNVAGFQVFITMPDIDYLGVSGSGFIRGENTFEVDNIELKVNGSGHLDLGLEASYIEGKISGSGEMILEGSAEEMDFRISGTGDLRAFELLVQKAEIDISGSGDAEVHVSDQLEVRIAGNGNVLYRGNPSLIVRISGSGEVIDAN